MKGDGVADELAGETIKDVFKNAEPVADLHACLTSSRGSNFRLRLLQALEVPLESDTIERLRIDAGINEYHRHLNMLLKFDLVCVQEIDGNKHYLRSELSERAVNGLRALGRRIGREEVDAIYAASLGPNSLRLFLRIYGDRREPDWDIRQIRYTAAEIGRLSLFLPRTIEGISAIDKLNEADVLVYQDDNEVHMQPAKARALYLYFLELYSIVAAVLQRTKGWEVNATTYAAVDSDTS